ncbi:PPC domain-containing protein [Sorangium sp. So ce375]|uniref:PPC domain-containing protein n=1 Tax=Sorangium sp. So ce375 TaxID=3133306 RepID=UPI003F5C6832
MKSWLTRWSRFFFVVLATAGCGSAPEPSARTCPINEILEKECTCGGDVFDAGQGAVVVCDGASLRDKGSTAPLAPARAEECNGLDDDLDGEVDGDDVCARACAPAEIEALSAKLRMPAPTDVTVPDGSGETPVLTLVNEVPSFCVEPAPPSTPEDVTVACGEVLTVHADGLTANTLRVAPGGVVRVVEPAALQISGELIVCPGATVQAGGEPSRDGDGGDGVDLQISAETLLVLGTVTTAGGTTLKMSGTARVGASGALTVNSARLLLAGLLDTSGPSHPDGYGEQLGGAPGGAVLVSTTTESFLSGAVRSTGGAGGSALGCGAGGNGATNGSVTIEVPVCCYDFNVVGGSGDGGGAGVLEDLLESPEAALDRGEHELALCDGEDRFALAGKAGQEIELQLTPGAGVDIDVHLLDEGGAIAARSEGVSDVERISVPENGDYTLRVFAAGPVSGPGGYHLSVR